LHRFRDITRVYKLGTCDCKPPCTWPDWLTVAIITVLGDKQLLQQQHVQLHHLTILQTNTIIDKTRLCSNSTKQPHRCGTHYQTQSFRHQHCGHSSTNWGLFLFQRSFIY